VSSEQYKRQAERRNCQQRKRQAGALCWGPLGSTGGGHSPGGGSGQRWPYVPAFTKPFKNLFVSPEISTRQFFYLDSKNDSENGPERKNLSDGGEEGDLAGGDVQAWGAPVGMGEQGECGDVLGVRRFLQCFGIQGD
jgi:hypothetical protein